MTHYAFIAPPLPSHMAALDPLARALIERGHRVTWVLQAGTPAGAPLQGAATVVLPPDPALGVGAFDRWPAGIAPLWHCAQAPAGWRALRDLIKAMAYTSSQLAYHGSDALRQLRPDVLIVDQMEGAGGLLARAQGLPYVSVANSLPVNREPLVPLPVMPFAYEDSEAARHRVAVSTAIYDWLMRPLGRALVQACERLGVAPVERLDQCLSADLQISQTPLAFDFPRHALPAHFHAVGPLRPLHPVRPLALPIDPQRPFVFSSLGTLQGGRFTLQRTIARACRQAGVQLLLAHCGRLDATQCDLLRAEGATWVTDFADQRAAIARADAVICHGGLNTVLDAIELATPVLAVPLANDQPGAAARLVRCGAGIKLAPRAASAAALARALHRLLREPGYAQSAKSTGEACRQGGAALARATDLIEALAPRRQPTQEASLAD